MGRPSGAHTHPPSGWAVAAVAAAGVVAVTQLRGAGPAVASAGRTAAHVLDLVLIAGAGLLGLAVAAGVTVLVVTRRRGPRQVERGWTATVDPPARPAAGHIPGLPAAPRSRPAMTALPPASGRPLERMPDAAGPREVHYHVHLPEGADARAVADALRDAPTP